MYWARRPPMESKAPALIRLSMTLRLTLEESIRPQNSPSELYGPFAVRSARIASRAAPPTCLTAARPKRMRSLMTVKSLKDSLMSGGRTSICSWRHSLMYLTTLSVFSTSQESRAARNWAG